MYIVIRFGSELREEVVSDESGYWQHCRANETLEDMHAQSETYENTEGDAKHEDVSREVVAVVMQHFRRVVAIRAQDVVRNDLLSVHTLSHTKVNHFELDLI